MAIPDFALERFFAKWEFVATHVLCSSDLETVGLGELLDLADQESRSLWENLRLGYTEAPGHRVLRQEIATLYESRDPDQIYCFAGAEEAIFVIANSLLGPEDHAIAFIPAYQSLYELARSTGADVTLIELKAESGWQVDPEEVCKAIRPNTKLIVLNTPHNPSGSLMSERDFRAVIAMATEAGATVLCDEVYRLSEFDSSRRLPAGCDLSPNAISLGVMSKAFGLAGLRIGWVAAAPSIIEKVARFKDYLSICNSAPSEILSIIALRAKHRLLSRNMEIIRSNLTLLDDFFTRWQDTLEWVRPQAGGTGFPAFRAGIDVDSLAQQLVHDTGVLILPGSVYGCKQHFRIGFGRSNFPEGLARFEEFLQGRLGRAL